jgi:hypothetical protein
MHVDPLEEKTKSRGDRDNPVVGTVDPPRHVVTQNNFVFKYFKLNYRILSLPLSLRASPTVTRKFSPASVRG